MEIDYLGVENESKEVKDKKKEEFIKKLKEAIKKLENKEKKEKEKSEKGTKKELEVLKLINQNRNWEEILSSSPYNLIIKKKGKFILLKYNQLESDMSNNIVQECRGLIIQPDIFQLTINPPIQQYKIASMRFTKFFNYGQEEAAKLEFPCEASEKIDGSLIGVWHDKDAGWHVSTSGNIYAEDAPLNIVGYQSYRDIFNLAWDESFFDKLNKDCTYIFELVSPYTRLIVPYKETKLYLLAIRNNITLEEFDRASIPIIAKLLFKDKISAPKSFICNNIEEIKSAVEKLTENNENFEGFVLCDKYFNRIKLKSSTYANLFFIKGEGVFSDKKILKLILDEQDDDIIGHFPEYTDDFNKIRRGLSLFITRLKNILKDGEKLYDSSKKQFAENIKLYENKDILFKAYECNYWNQDENFQANFLQKYIENISVSKLIDFVKEQLENE